MSSYSETISYLYASTPAFHLVGGEAYKPGLQNTEALMAYLGNPHRSFPSIHIAGTNGKGSTSHLIAASLQQAGYKVGLYTSPHLVDFRERIRVNGQMIPEEEVVRFVQTHQPFLETLHPSFFETTMALCFDYFARQKVDIAVVEVGLGGRLDSTNIVHPLLSVITNIGLDHTEFLGDTLAKIALEKAGIIKDGVPVVIGETDPETSAVFIKVASACHAPILFADQQPEHILPSSLTGCYQHKNLQTAYVALAVLRNQCHFSLPEEAIQSGFQHVCSLTGLRGRWETLSQHPLTICDTGHNTHGWQYLAPKLAQIASETQLHVVFGMVSDKDVHTIMQMFPKKARYYFTQANTHRAIPASVLLDLARRNNLLSAAYDTVKEATTAALQCASPTDTVFIGGSNYVVGEALCYYPIPKKEF